MPHNNLSDQKYEIEHANGLVEEEQFEEAERVLVLLMGTYFDSRKEKDKETLRVKGIWAKLLLSTERYDEGMPVILDVVENNKEILSEDDPQIVVDMALLADFYEASNELEKVEDIEREILNWERKYRGDERWICADTHALAHTCFRLGKYEEAVTLLEEQLKKVGKDYPNWALEAQQTLEDMHRRKENLEG